MLHGVIPVIRLNKIFRQAAQSNIIVSSHEVNEGINFLESDNKGTNDDLEFLETDTINEATAKILELYDNQTQIITPTKKGDLGTKTLNKLIQAKFNPPEAFKSEKKFGDIIFREGDKIMQTKNNYDIEWFVDTDYESKNENHISFKERHGLGIFNGELGSIRMIDENSSEIQVEFDDGKVAFYTFQDMDQLDLSYAMTVHKSQGSEFSKEIMIVMGASKLLLTRNILYTGMTRAKDKLYLIGNTEVLKFMIENDNIKKRNTGLNYKLEKTNEKYNS